MEPEYSLPCRGDPPEENPMPAEMDDQNRERVFGSEMVVMECDLVGLDQSSVDMLKILDRIQEKASSLLESSFEGKEAEEEKFTSLLKERALELEREKKIWLFEKSVNLRLEEKENDFDVIKLLEFCVMRLVLEKKVEEVIEELEEKRKEVELVSKSNDEKSRELERAVKVLLKRRSEEAEFLEVSLKELEVREKEISLFDEAVKERLIELEKKDENFEAKQREKSEEMGSKSKLLELKERELERAVKEFALKEKAWIEGKSKEAELMKVSLKELEEREKELSFLNETVREKLTEVEKKEEIFEVKQREETEEMGSKRKLLELEEKKLEERVKETELKQRELEKAEEQFDMKQKGWLERKSKEAELVEIALKELKERKKELSFLDETVKEKLIEVDKKEENFEVKQREKSEEMRSKSKLLELEETKLEERVKEIELKERGLERAVKEFDRKEKAWIERKSQETELVKVSLKEIKQREKELSFLDQTVIEKLIEVEKKDEFFEAKQREKAEEMELKSKLLELEQKKLQERVKEIELNQRELEERSQQAKTCKRSRVKLLVDKGSEADSLLRPAKRHKPLREHVHNHEDKETDCIVSASVEISEAHEGDVESFISIDDSSDEEDPEPIISADSEFNDFEKTMSSFAVGQTWALYAHMDDMPRWYGRIKRIIKSRSSLQVTWLVPKDDESIPVACGRFKYGTTETISYLCFSHEMHPLRYGRYGTINPIKGETWALFRDWNNNLEQHKHRYRYDFVEVLLDFDEHQGVGVAYLGKVEGFVSVFKHTGQHGVEAFMIAPTEMNRFSHRVPSFRLNGEEKEGVPTGSFELDPAAIPSEDCGKDKIPIIILD